MIDTRTFVLSLYKDDKFLRELKITAENRHHAEEIARLEIERTDADSMGAIGEIT